MTRGSAAGPGGPGGAPYTESEVERTLGTLSALNPASPHHLFTHGSPVVPLSPAPDRSGPDPAAAGPAVPTAPQTIDDIYRSHRMSMVRLAILLVDDISSAEDVVQDAFAGLYRNWSGLRDTQAAIGYLRIAVVNGSRSMLRRRRTARAYVPPHVSDARSAESMAMLTAEHQAVISAMGELAPRQREILVLRYYGGLSEAEIAEATGLTTGTVKSTASRAVAKLGTIIKNKHQ